MIIEYSDPNGTFVFRNRAVIFQDLVAALCMVGFFIAEFLVHLRGRGHVGIAIISVIAIAVGLVAAGRSLMTATIQISPSVLTVTSLVRTYRLTREDVSFVDTQRIKRGIRMMSEPYLRLKDGSSRRLWEFAVSASDTSAVEELVMALGDWIAGRSIKSSG